MGNTTCACASNRRHHSDPDNYDKTNLKVEGIKHPKSATPYDNGPINSLSIDGKFPFDISDNAIEAPIISQKSNAQYQTQNGNQNHPVCFRSNLTSLSDTRTTVSVFSTDDYTEDDDELSNNIKADNYNAILKEFLIGHYPMNDGIIRTMIERNLLLQQDAKVILSCSNNHDKSEFFLNNFVFSEVNICKLATFLHVLITERSPILAEFKKGDEFFKSIVDHIYYVVNLLSLLAEYSGQEEKLLSAKYLSSMINVNCVQNVKVLKKRRLEEADNGFFVNIHLSNIAFQPRFWKDFACINEHFRCCQELTLSSCDLQAEDVFNLGQGFLTVGLLRYLDVSANPLTDDGLKYLEQVFLTKNSLNSLNIACCSLTSSGMEQFLAILAHSSTKCNLRHLNISHNDLRNMAEDFVLLLTKLPLTSLGMKSVHLREQRALFQSLKLNYSLKQIDISGNKLLGNDVTFLAAGLAYNSSLKIISLSMIGVLKSDCLLLNNTLLMNKALVSIDLSDNLIGDEGAETLKDILTMKRTLEELHLRRCGISLHGTLVLLRKASEEDCKLKVLDLCYNHSPRISIVVDSNDMIRKIQDLIHHITLVKDMRILLWGTLDELPFIHNDCIEF